MTVAEAQAQHGMYLHLWILADNCADAHKDNWPRRNAAYRVREFCQAQMTEMFAVFADELGSPEATDDTKGKS